MWIKKTVTGALLMALTASLMLATAGVASAGTSPENEFVRLINAERASRGKGALAAKSDLTSVARAQSKRMAAKEKIWHNPNLASDVKGWTVVGENVGMGPAVKSLHQAFMNSKGHRDNILLGDFNQIGVGVVVDGDMMYVTQVFARRASSTTTSAPKRSTTRSATPARTTVAVAAVTSAPKATAPKAPPIKATPRTVDVLVRLMALGEDAA